MTKSELSNSKLIKKNVLFNVFGMVVPLGLAVIATPFLVNGLGLVKFGLLTICWAILGYFSFLDFGVSRSLTSTVARYRGQDQLSDAWISCWTAIVTLLLVFLPAALLVYLFRQNLADLALNPPADLHADVVTCVGLIGLSLPVVVLTGVFKGGLEGFERFDITNLIRLPMAIWSYAGPVLLLPFTNSIVDVVLFLMLGRFVTMMLFGASLNRLRNGAAIHFSRTALADLFSTGGWIGLSTVMSPLMIFIDRFVLAAKIALEKVAYYTTPMDAVTKLLQPVDAVAGVFFPALSRASQANPEEYQRLYRLMAELISLLMLPCCLVIGLFSYEIMSLWISQEFANNSSSVLSVLSVGVFANALARAPWMALQANGRAKFTAQLQIFELLPYGIALYWASSEFGVMGAALVWSLRVTLDAFFLFLAVDVADVSRQALIYWAGLAFLVATCSLMASLSIKVVVAVLGVVILGYRVLGAFGVDSFSKIPARIRALKKNGN